MKKVNLIYVYGVLAVVILTVLSYVLQMYRFTALEEEYILLYDSTYITRVLMVPGGLARLFGSWLSQHFICRFAGPLLTALVYTLTIAPLCRIAVMRRASAWTGAIASIPCFCLMLCIENSAFEYRGIIAVMLNCMALWLYASLGMGLRAGVRILAGVALTIVLYLFTGPAAIAFAVSSVLYDVFTRRHAIVSIVFVPVCLGIAYCIYLVGMLPTLSQALTPSMYYDMGSTYRMMIYALCSIPIFIICVGFSAGKYGSSRGAIIVASIVLLAITGAALGVYGAVHSRPNYENLGQRYYARHRMWDSILNMPYDGKKTPYTSYRFLALAHKGVLDREIVNYRPFISYIFENKPKVKRLDQQVYSDIYYDCCYMAAARRSAFDTDIVTPGHFNPYETQKLAAINIAYGDYAVAQKLLSMLDKTKYYSSWANDHRRFLYNDSLVMADPQLSRMRRAIPSVNSYLSPKGMLPDLTSIVDSVPDNLVADQFLKAFKILTNIQ